MINLKKLKSDFFGKSDLHTRLTYEIAKMIFLLKADFSEMQFNRLFGAALLLPHFRSDHINHRRQHRNRKL